MATTFRSSPIRSFAARLRARLESALSFPTGNTKELS